MTNSPSEDCDLLDRLAEEFAARFRRGERPALKEYTDRYPELAEEIREFFPALVKVERAKGLRKEDDDEDRRESASVHPPLYQVGDYRILREIGHGGMGVVYEAEQISLGRRVALKLLPRHVAGDPRILERFRREARAAARLHHTNIVPVFEVGREGEICYYAMQFIQGQSLDLVYDEIRRLRGRPRDLGAARSAAARISLARFRAGAENAIGQGQTLAGQSGVSQVVGSLLSGRFEVGSGLALLGCVTHPDSEPSARGAISPGPGELDAALDPGALAATECRAMEPRRSPPPAANPDSQQSSSSLNSAVLPDGTQISAVESRGFKYARSVARIGLQAAHALAYAHARGVVHRDIKPSNLLLDTDGVVWITDFGLAKSDEDRLTQTGDILGTVRYMAPERFRGEADLRSDIYALGLTLYELLTLEPAFDTGDRLRLIEQVKAEDPIAPRMLDRRVPRDLETIVLKAIDKDAKRRYPTADAMAEDLRRFLDDEPILARRQSHLERYLRWARRHPVIASVGAVLTAVLVLATVASLLAAGHMASLVRTKDLAARSEHIAKLSAEANRREADAQRDRAERNLYIARIGQAESSLRLFDSATARALLDQCTPKPGEEDRRGWEWSYLDRWCQPEPSTLKVPTIAETNVLAVSPDGRFLVVGCAGIYPSQQAKEPTVPTCVIDLKDGVVRHKLAGHGPWVTAVSFRPDGNRIAAVGSSGTIKIWESDTGRELRTLRGTGTTGRCLSWSPDGRRLASADRDGFIRICDSETGEETARISHPAEHLSWSPDGTRIAAAGGSELVRIWVAADGQPASPVLNLGAVCGIAWAPEGRRLAGVSVDGSLVVWDTQTGQVVFKVKQITQLSCVAFSPDGNRLATGGAEGIIRLHDALSGAERAAYCTDSTNVSSLAFHPDGRWLFAAGWRMGGVKIYDVEHDPRGRGVTPWLDQPAALAFVGETARLHGIGWQGGQLASLSFSTGGMRYRGNFPVTISAVWPRGDFAFSGDGRLLAAPLLRDPTVVGVWEVELGRLARTIRGNSALVTAVAFSPDGLRLATGVRDKARNTSAVTIWDVGSSRSLLTFDVAPDWVETLAFSSDGRRLAAGGMSGSREAAGWVTVWDAQNGALVRTDDRVGVVLSVAFHPDGTLLAIAEINEYVHLWDPASGALISRPGPRGVGCVAFTPDGRLLAALGHDGNVHLSDARTAEQLLVLRNFGPPLGGGGWTARLAFSADGSRIAANMSNYLNLWEARPRRDPQVEPAPDDVTGWLRLSRSFATLGDNTRSLAAFDKAMALSTDLPEPWISHALAEGTELPQAELALGKALTARSVDPVRWLACARELERADRKRQAAIALERARVCAQERLAVAPDDEPAAWVLADLLKDGMTALADGNWNILVPLEIKSAGGATLTRLPDGSILASGENPDQDSLTLFARTELAGITGLRLEVLPDPSVDATGPGRQIKFGDLHVTEVSAQVASGDDFSKTRAVEFTRAIATNIWARFAFASPRGTFDRDGVRRWGWDLVEQIGLRNAIAFATAAPVETRSGSTWIIRLDCRSRSKQTTLGRFRLSVTNAPVTLFETSLHKSLIEPEWNGRTRLGVVYYLKEEWQAAARALQIAADAPEGTGTDRFLLALALHHLDRRQEAHRYLESGIDWLEHNKNGGTLRTLVVEAVAVIEGMSRVEAEARMYLDPNFPRDPFAR